MTTFENELAGNAPGAAMAILENGKLAFAYGIGTKGPNSATPVCPSTSFRIGSMTKALTATAYLRGVAEGKARLGEKLIDIAPDVTLPVGADFTHLTMRELLSQNSGVSDVTGVDPVSGPTDEAYLSQYLTGSQFASDVLFMYPPSALWFYSNTNSMLTGLAIERTTGLTYRQAVRGVTRSLGMFRTTMLPSDVMADGDYTNGATLRQPNPDGSPGDLTPVSSAVNAAVEPAGGAFSNVVEFAHFMEFVANGDDAVLPRALWAQMRSPQVDTDQEGRIDSYGYGLYAGSGLGIVGPGQYFPTPYIGHGGDQAGWSSDWFILPQTGFGIVILVNSDYGFFENTMTHAIEDLAGVQPAPIPGVDRSQPASFPSYAGSYNDPYQLGRVIVSDASGVMTVSMPDLDALGIPYGPTLAPLDRDSFAITIEGGEFLATFIRGAGGAFDWMRVDHVSVARREKASDAGTGAQ